MRLKIAAVAACSALVTLVLMSVSGAFGASNAGTFNMSAGSNLGVTCPNALSNSNRQSDGETVNCAANPTTTTTSTTTVPVTTTTVPSTTTTVPSTTTTTVPVSGGTCTNPTFSTSNYEGTDALVAGWQVNNDAWAGTAGPQSIYVCNEASWYATSNQTNNQGQVETYPDSEYSISGSETIAQYSQITSTFSEQFPTDGTIDAAYDLWLNNYSTEIMIWNEDSGTNDYWNTQGTPVTIGGVDYQFANSGGPLVFIMKNQEKAGTVDILAVLNYLAANGYVKSTDVPTQLEYGVEICSTVGTETFPMTGLSFTLDGVTYN